MIVVALKCLIPANCCRQPTPVDSILISSLPCPPACPPACLPACLLSQSWAQQVCWTLEDLPAALQRRDHQRRRAQFALSHQAIKRSSRMRRMLRGAEQAVLELLGLAEAEQGKRGDDRGDSGAGKGSGAEAWDAGQGQAGQRQQQRQQGQGDGPPDGQIEVGEDDSEASKESKQGHGHQQEQEEQQQQEQQRSTEQQKRSQQQQQQEQQEGREPMFCMELAVRLFPWSQYAYRHWVSGRLGQQYYAVPWGATVGATANVPWPCYQLRSFAALCCCAAIAATAAVARRRQLQARHNDGDVWLPGLRGNARPSD